MLALHLDRLRVRSIQIIIIAFAFIFFFVLFLKGRESTVICALVCSLMPVSC